MTTEGHPDGCCSGGADEEILAALMTHEGWLDRQGWDRPAELRWMARDTLAGQVAIVPSHIPEALYREPHGRPFIVVQRLAAITAVMNQAPPMRDGFTFAGVAFDIEGWGVAVPDPALPATAEIKYVDALIAERRLREHPRREETRMVEAIDLAGHEYSVVRIRNEGPAEGHTWGTGSAPEDRGTCIDALRLLAAELRRVLGLPAPAPDYRTVFGLS